MSRLVVCVALALPALAQAWGFDGHRRLASLMQNPLPAGHCLRAWYLAQQTSALQDKSCDPDRWRSTDADEWPRHFLQVDQVTPPASYPRDYEQVVRTLGDRAARLNGTVPWRVEALYGELVAAFTARDVPRILDRSFVLSHYVFDAFSVLHDTKDSDPNAGLHARWESDMLSSASNLNAIASSAVGYFGTPGRADPRYATFDIVLVGTGLVPQLVQADLAADGGVAGLFTRSRDLTSRRWGDGLTLMASLLWTAWAEAGAPDLPGFTLSCARDVPMGQLVLRGYPVPGGFTPRPPDAGVAPPDAGPDDAGAGGGTGAGGGDPGGFGGGFVFGGGLGGGGDSGGGAGCACGAGPSFLSAWAFGAWALVRRARRGASKGCPREGAAC